MISTKGVAWAVVAAMVMGACGTVADAGPSWEWTCGTGYNGFATVHGTINGVIIEPEIGTEIVDPGDKLYGNSPNWATDMRVKLVGFLNDKPHVSVWSWDLPVYDPVDRRWQMVQLEPWQRKRIPSWQDWLILPTPGDSLGDFPEIHVGVDLNQWCDDPRPLQQTYFVINGTCPDLPGYIIGTTPIVFNKDAPPDVNPLETTPLTGVLSLGGYGTLTPEPATMSLLAFGGLGMLMRRRDFTAKRGVAAWSPRQSTRASALGVCGK